MDGELSRVYVKKIDDSELLIELQDTEWSFGKTQELFEKGDIKRYES